MIDDDVHRWLDRIDAIADASPDELAADALDELEWQRVAFGEVSVNTLREVQAVKQFVWSRHELNTLRAARVRHLQELAGATLAILTLVLAVLSCMLM